MFSIEAGKILGTAIANNDTLENLNLSWNAFRLDGAQAFAKGVAVSLKPILIIVLVKQLSHFRQKSNYFMLKI